MKILRILTKLLFILTLLISIQMYSAKIVFASSLSLKISPTLFKIEAKPPADVWAPFILENQSNQPVNLTIGYKAFDPQASQNGTVAFLKNGQQISGLDKKIFDKIQVVNTNNISLSSISLGPKQSLPLRLHIVLPNNEPSSDYYFSLLFLENPNITDQNISINPISNQSAYSSLLLGIGANILLAVGDKEVPQASINDFSVPYFLEAGPVPFTLTVFNSGSHFITPEGFIFIKNMFGQTIGKIKIPSTVILSGTGRTITNYILSNENVLTTQNENQNQSLQIIWPEYFLLGLYTATLTLSLSADGPTYTRSIHFLVFPINIILGILIILAILIYIYKRIKNKNKLI